MDSNSNHINNRSKEKLIGIYALKNEQSKTCSSSESANYFKNLEQAINKIEQLLFDYYQINQNSRQELSQDYKSTNALTTQDEVKFLSTQVENLKQVLLVKELELQFLQQELNYTSEDVNKALKSDMLTLTEAKVVAQDILSSKQPISEYLAQLLNAIYNSTV